MTPQKCWITSHIYCTGEDLFGSSTYKYLCVCVCVCSPSIDSLSFVRVHKKFRVTICLRDHLLVRTLHRVSEVLSMTRAKDTHRFFHPYLHFLQFLFYYFYNHFSRYRLYISEGDLVYYCSEQAEEGST